MERPQRERGVGGKWRLFLSTSGGGLYCVAADGNRQVGAQIDLAYQPVDDYSDRSKTAYWNGRNDNGELVASGVYFYQSRAGDYSQMRRLVIVR